MNSTAKSADQPTQAGVLYYEKNIRPLLAQRCYSCHSQRKGKSKGGLLLDSRAGWTRGGDSGPAIVPGDVDASRLVRAIRYTDADLQMPPSEPLPADAIARLEHWIRIGAPGPIERQTAAIEDPSDPVAGKSHWAFQPLLQQAPPIVRNLRWPRSAIDRYVLARLEKERLDYVPDADARELVRRLYFQLTGIPPSLGQVQSFLNDKRPEALERLIDRLLSSPQFGQRWGRHWLDLARYADSNGLDENFLFREAWRYRNWVIDAVNADLPFDRFVQKQIAGDLLPFESIAQRDQQRIAAGFLVVGPKVLLGIDEKRQRMEIADEQIDTIGRAILGQTLGCARCHDHKFDPFPTADYYALAGILTSTRVMERRHMLNQQRVMEQLIGLGPGGEDVDAAYEKYWREQPELKKKTQQAKTLLAMLKNGNRQSIATFLEGNPNSIAEDAKDATQSIAQRISAQQAWIAELSAALANAPPIPPRAMVPTDVDIPSDEHVRLAGQFDVLGERIPRGFLQVLCDDTAVELPDNHSGRIELARWLTNRKNRAGQLTARVQANRIWHRLIGSGIVRTVDNFGRTGEEPSHSELLDYLATQLIESGWSLKALVRQIALSRTLALSSQHNSASHARDPENRLLWRAHRGRLDPESLRDAMLATADQLDLNPMDSTVWYLKDQATAVGDNKVRRRTDFPCRSVYLPVIRNDLPELFEVFDFADPHTTTGARSQTTVPTQGLYMLNGEMVMDAAQATARRVLAMERSNPSTSRIDIIFELILNNSPTESERQALQSFLQQTERLFDSEGKNDAKLRALTIACHAMFASSKFQYLE